MKDDLRRLQWCLKLFGYDAFYCVSVDDMGVTLQGKYESCTALIAMKLGFVSGMTGKGYIEMIRGNIRIVLT